MVTVAANQGLVNDVFRSVRTVDTQSSKFSFEANIATNSSNFTGADGGGFAAAGRRLQTGGANLNIPLSFGKGLAKLCGKHVGNACGGARQPKTSTGNDIGCDTFESRLVPRWGLNT